MTCRLQSALQLLEHSSYSIKELSQLCGFASENYFARVLFFLLCKIIKTGELFQPSMRIAGRMVSCLIRRTLPFLFGLLLYCQRTLNN